MTHEATCEIDDRFTGKDILVTGGLGFLGGRLVDALVEGGAKVTVLDVAVVAESGHRLGRRSVASPVRLIRGSITDAPLLRALFDESPFEVIFNLAAAATVIERAHAEPRATIEVNTVGVIELLEAARHAQTRPSCFVHASTDKVYGDSEAAYDENDALRPVGIYDSAKAAADILVRAYQDAYGIPTVVLRLCNIFGPFDENCDFRLVPKAMKALFAHDPPRPPELYHESVRHYRDYLYVADCIRAMLAVASEPSCIGQAFNLPGSGHLSTPDMLVSVLQAAEAVERHHDPRRADRMLENSICMRASSSLRVKAISSQHATGEKLREVTGFRPEVRLEEGLLATAEWYRGRFAALREADRSCAVPRATGAVA